MPRLDPMRITAIPFQRGFTLLEALVVIVITGIIGTVVAVFIAVPVKGYADAARRAEMSDTVDTALRRIARDLRLALPNSVRLSGNQALEFLPTRIGGRYRADVDVGGTGDPLDFSQADKSFDVLGSVNASGPGIDLVAGDQIVVYNLGISGADAYSGSSAASDNRRAYSGSGGNNKTNVPITSDNRLPFDSPTHRFQVIEGPVTYICDSGNLWRYWGYAIQVDQNNTNTVAKLDALVGTATTTRGSALLAQNVQTCIFTYEPGVTQRSALIAMRLTLVQSGETVSLYHEVHVSNVP